MYDVELQLSAVAPPCKVPFKLLITAVLFGATNVKLTSKISLGVPSASDTLAIICTDDPTKGVAGEVILELITRSVFATIVTLLEQALFPSEVPSLGVTHAYQTSSARVSLLTIMKDLLLYNSLICSADNDLLNI